jgi:AAHS family 4-hydroxybenzoate transporter-like MFS transporter
MSGAQTGLNALAPTCYPTRARATGVSWMLGFGRLGGILGSLVGGALLSLGFSFSTVFSVLAVPAIIAAVAIVMNRLALRFITSPMADA